MSEKRISLASILIASIGVVALIGGIVFFVVGRLGGQGDGEPAESAAAESQPEGADPSAPSVDPDDPEASRCGLTAYSDTNDLETTAPETKWEWVVQSFMVAKGSEHGPGIVQEDGVRYCYARTPTGALYAAYNIAAMGHFMAPSQYGQYVTIPGSDRDQMLSETAVPYKTEYKFEPAGFRIEKYDQNEVIVDVAFLIESTLLNFKMQLKWLEGDWLVVPVDDGSFFLESGAPSSIAGYIVWETT